MSNDKEHRDRRHHDRRQQTDRREEIRFEPGKPNRRRLRRRESDRDPWEEQATVDD